MPFGIPLPDKVVVDPTIEGTTDLALPQHTTETELPAVDEDGTIHLRLRLGIARLSLSVPPQENG